MRRWAWAAVALAVSCGPDDPDEFREAYAEVWCDREEECALGEFQRHYSSMDDCRLEVEDDPHLPGADRCDWSEDVADRCLEYLHETDCAGFEWDEILERCGDVWSC